ncbi:MAG: glutathione S-transferase family protein [Proteobacteria bacterium]|nr:glutathione S-transferase family protein [Pseudomonadota bacterium]
MRIWGRDSSFNVQKVLWMLEELSVVYEQIQVGGKYGRLNTLEFAQKNPRKKIPVIHDGSGYIYESHTIIRYLAANYSRRNLWKDSPFERSLIERWMDWSQTAFQPSFMRLFWGYYRMPVEKRDLRVVNSSLLECDEHLKLLNLQLEKNSYLVGDQFSIADITCGAVLYRLCNMGLDIELPLKVQVWYRQLKRRDGYQKWIMKDFSELKGRESF